MVSAKLEQAGQMLGLRDSRFPPWEIGSPQQMQMQGFIPFHRLDRLQSPLFSALWDTSRQF